MGRLGDGDGVSVGVGGGGGMHRAPGCVFPG